MPFDPLRLSQAVSGHYGEMPHPDIPELKVNQYQAFARVAARMFGSDAPTGQQVGRAYHSLASSGIAPGEFERLWDVSRPLANRLLNRDPTLHDMMQLAGQSPSAVQAYYMSHPHPDAPEVQAGKMAQYNSIAAPIAHRTVGRDPNHIELQRFANGDYGAHDIVAHYTDDGSLPKRPGA